MKIEKIEKEEFEHEMFKVVCNDNTKKIELQRIGTLHKMEISYDEVSDLILVLREAGF